jgi:hypothetical protein
MTADADGFVQHVREAIALNRERMPRYAALTGGRSLAISRRLILAERLTLPAAWYVDRRARPFQARGLRLGIDEFVSMAAAPEFQDRCEAPSLQDYRMEDGPAVRRLLQAAWRSGGFPALRDAAHREVERLSVEPRFHCMLRHLLESIRRAAHLAPRHEETARAAGLPSTQRVSTLLLRLQLYGITSAAWLDHLAAPIQAEGVPILCQDLPPIPLEP